MGFLDTVKEKAAGLVAAPKNERAARQQKAEADIEADPKVAGSRANTDDDDGSYVGRTSPQFDAETQQSGAEARSEADRDPS